MYQHHEINNSIGIVVIGRNEGERLRRCLESVVEVGVPIVYVDSDSSDSSLELAEKMNVGLLKLDIRRPMNAARARNEGFNYLIDSYPGIEFIQFVDGDCEIAPGWIDKANQALQSNTDVGVVCGRLREKNYKASIFSRIFDIGWYIPAGEVKSCGGIASIRRIAFQEAQGFNENLIAGEEPELHLRLRRKNWKIICLDSDMGTHDGGMTNLKQWWIRQVKVGYGYAHGKNWGGYSQQRRSIWIWSCLIPILIIVTAWPTKGSSILALAIFPIQVLRAAYKLWRQRLKPKDALLYSVVCLFAKVPQLKGILKFLTNNAKAGPENLDYKNKV